MREALWLLIPVKSLRCGKRRLETVLSAAERMRLNEFFLRRMLTVAASFPGLERTAIVSDADDSLSLAANLGAGTIRTAQAELNAALTDGRDDLRRRGAERIVMLPVDLPLVEGCNIGELAALGGQNPVVISPDRNGTGTNALALHADVPFSFRFGAGSYRAHQAEARRCGVAPLLHENAGIAQDVDLPADLSLVSGLTAALHYESGRTAEVSAWRLQRAGNKR
jgi:2-phospho-L-lactate/phosphoenolpyruvate guanylyltransferase